ncbi:MAG: 50S ribosome-binding GTPase [Planctomycetaceae bacterium]|nr:50S ribosome-binding GTPase [Planctomycetaceae bacterium]
MQISSANSPDEMIAALASATGPAARGIIRISGVETLSLLHSFLSVLGSPPEIDAVSARQIEIDYPIGKSRSLLPMQILVWPTSRSYTGQPAAEIHTLSSAPLLEAILEQLYQLGARPAQPGEFTLRSFLSGRITLVQAEAVLGVIDARSDTDLDQALTQLAGGISPLMRKMRDQLLDDLADLEAGLDFVEEDIEFIDRLEFQGRVQELLAELDRLCAAARERMINTTQRRIVLAGLPNAGKSTLFNALTSGDAIVSEIEGTTTDYLIGCVNWEGTEIAFHDTAGWEQTVSREIEQSAQSFRKEEYDNADLIIWCSPTDLTDSEITQDRQNFQQLLDQGLPAVLLETKIDLLQESTQPQSDFLLCKGVSADSGEGLQGFRKAVLSRLNLSDNQYEILGSTASRCKDSLLRARSHLQSSFDLLQACSGDELIAEELRCTLHELGLVLGQVYTDDLLDRVFSKFCIGK